MLSVNRLKVSEETFAPGPSGPVQPITQDKCEGLTTLSYELLLEIVACFPKIPATAVYSAHDSNRSPIRYRQPERFTDLKALSQTCKKLRSVALPLAWERLEVCSVEPVQCTSYNKQMASALERKCKCLLQSPHLIPYVRILVVTIRSYKVNTILPTFAECLQALTNLHTIQIVNFDHFLSLQRAIKSAFEGRIFPCVRTAILPYAARDILIGCPNVEDVTYNDDAEECQIILFYAIPSQMYGTLCDALVATRLTKLKTLRRVVHSEDMIKNMPKIAPNLELISVFHTVIQMFKDPILLDKFQNFKNLDTIEIHFTKGSCLPEHEAHLQQLKPSLVRNARDVLNASKSTKNKCIRLLYTSARLKPEEILL